MEGKGGFHCVKTTLLVLFSVILMGTVVLFMLFVYAVLSHGDSVEMADKVRKQKQNLIVNMILVGVYLIEAIIGLIGTIRENLCIMVTVTWIGVIGFVFNVILQSWSVLIICSFYTILTAIFANMLYNRGKRYEVM